MEIAPKHNNRLFITINRLLEAYQMVDKCEMTKSNHTSNHRGLGPLNRLGASYGPIFRLRDSQGPLFGLGVSHSIVVNHTCPF